MRLNNRRPGSQRYSSVIFALFIKVCELRSQYDQVRSIERSHLIFGFLNKLCADSLSVVGSSAPNRRHNLRLRDRSIYSSYAQKLSKNVLLNLHGSPKICLFSGTCSWESYLG